MKHLPAPRYVALPGTCACDAKTQQCQCTPHNYDELCAAATDAKLRADDAAMRGDNATAAKWRDEVRRLSKQIAEAHKPAANPAAAKPKTDATPRDPERGEAGEAAARDRYIDYLRNAWRTNDHD